MLRSRPLLSGAGIESRQGSGSNHERYRRNRYRKKTKENKILIWLLQRNHFNFQKLPVPQIRFGFITTVEKNRCQFERKNCIKKQTNVEPTCLYTIQTDQEQSHQLPRQTAASAAASRRHLRRRSVTETSTSLEQWLSSLGVR